jgi:hypothetical protein
MAAILDNFKSNLGILARAVNSQSNTIKEYETRIRVLESNRGPESVDSSSDKIALLTTKLNELKSIIITEDRLGLIISELKKTIITEDKIKTIVTDILNNMLNSATPDIPAIDADTLESLTNLASPNLAQDDITIVDSKVKKPRAKKVK